MLNHFIIGTFSCLSLFALAWAYLRLRYSPIIFMLLTTAAGGIWGYIWGYVLSGGDGSIEALVAGFSALIGLQFGFIMWYFVKKQTRQ